MNRLKRDLPLYVLAGSFIFYGITSLVHQGNDGGNTELASRVTTLENQNAQMMNTITRLKMCAAPIQGTVSGAFVNGIANLRFCQ